MKSFENSLVYHYCDLNAFLSIIKTKTLWLSDIRKSNDTAECKYLLMQVLWALKSRVEGPTIKTDKKYKEKYCKEAIDYLSNILDSSSYRIYLPDGLTEVDIEMTNQEVENDIKQIESEPEEDLRSLFQEMSEGKILDEIIEDYELDTHAAGEEYKCDKFEPPIYTICFSEDGDLLSQWRGYAADGEGVAIGFKKKYLKQWRYLTDNYCCDFVAMVYDDMQTYKYARECSNKLLELIEKKCICKSSDKRLEIVSEIKRLMKEILRESIKYKNGAFFEEREYRLVFDNGSTFLDGQILFDGNLSEELSRVNASFHLSDLKFRSMKGKICSYYELSFAHVANDFIGEIIIGPKSQVKTADIEYLLSAYGYNMTSEKNTYDQRSIYICKSSLTYH